MNVVEGDGLKGQPAEGVADDLDSMVQAMDEGEEDAPELEEEGEESEGSEEVEGEEEEEGEEPTFTIKVDGKEVTLKQSEILEQAQKGFDYTKKTMALAEERKAVEQDRAHANAMRQQTEQAFQAELGRLQALEQFYDSQVGQPPPVEWAQQDAAYYLAQKELHDQRKGQLSEARAAIERIQEDQQRYRQAWFQNTANETERELQNTLPGWNERTIDELAQYVDKHGLKPEHFDSAYVMPGLWKMVHKAMQYDRIKEKAAQGKQTKPEAVQKVAKVTSANNPSELVRKRDAAKRFDANPTLSNLAQLL